MPKETDEPDVETIDDFTERELLEIEAYESWKAWRDADPPFREAAVDAILRAVDHGKGSIPIPAKLADQIVEFLEAGKRASKKASAKAEHERAAIRAELDEIKDRAGFKYDTEAAQTYLQTHNDPKWKSAKTNKDRREAIDNFLRRLR